MCVCIRRYLAVGWCGRQVSLSLVLNVCRLLHGAVDGGGRCGGDGRRKGEADGWQ